jgi:hypothetical protein
VGSVANSIKEAKSELTAIINGKVDQGEYDSKINDLEESIDNAIDHTDTIIAGLALTDSAVDGSYVSAVSQSNGKITVSRESLPSVVDNAVAGSYVSAVKQVNGKIEVSREEIPVYSLEEGSADGTVKFNGNNVPVHGLGSAAYVGVSTFATAAQGTNADNALSKANANESLIKGMNLSKVSGYITEVAQLNGNVTATSVSNIPGEDITVEVINSKVNFASTNVNAAINELVSFWEWEEINA